MAISYSISALPTHILVLAEGNYDLADAVRGFKEALSAARTHRQSRILIDGRKVTGNPSLMQRYEFGESIAHVYAQAPDGNAALTAIVGSEPVIHANRFGETVAVNRAVPLKVTTDMQEALNWLGIVS